MSLAQLGEQRLLVVGSAGTSDASVSRREARTRARVEAIEVGAMFAGVGDVVGHARQPFQWVHRLEVPAERWIHAGAIEHGLLAIEVHELLEWRGAPGPYSRPRPRWSS